MSSVVFGTNTHYLIADSYKPIKNAAEDVEIYTVHDINSAISCFLIFIKVSRFLGIKQCMLYVLQITL